MWKTGGLRTPIIAIKYEMARAGDPNGDVLANSQWF